MALSIFTNSASMSSNNAMNRATNSLSTAMQRLGTGKRINSAADDAAGLQIASRLQAQVNGMAVAKDNTSKASAMLQTAEGAFEEITQILYRMKDLATQAADDTNNKDDRAAMASEFEALNGELANIMGNTSYGSEKLLSTVEDTPIAGKLGTALQFQIGSGADETLKADFSTQLTTVVDGLKALTTADLTTDAASANAVLDNVNKAVADVGTIRSSLGATINRLGHTANNLSNMSDNTNLNIGVIRDADFATEATAMTRNNMLAQSSQAMLKQANGMGQLILGLLG